MAAFKVVVKHFDEASKRMAGVKCQIKASLRGQGIMTSGTVIYGKTGREKALVQIADPHVARAIERDYELLDYLARDKADARRQVSMMSKRFPAVERLMRMPGWASSWPPGSWRSWETRTGSTRGRLRASPAWG